jgi:hypothetical protein
MVLPASSGLTGTGSDELGALSLLFQDVTLAPLRDIDGKHLFVYQAAAELKSPIGVG